MTLPPLHKQAWNLATTLGRFLAHPRVVTRQQYEERMKTCDGCEHRDDTRCSLCGCYIELKGYLKVSRCEDGRWPEL